MAPKARRDSPADAPKTSPRDSNEATSEREIVLSRVVDAPRELVWEAFTRREHIARWWGPNGFTTTIEELDVRLGGRFKHVMHGPDGTDYPNLSVFREVVKPERITYSHGGGKQGGYKGASFEATWSFEALGPSRTKITGRMVFPSAADRDHVVEEYGAIEGGRQHLARLAEYLDDEARLRRFSLLSAGMNLQPKRVGFTL